MELAGKVAMVTGGAVRVGRALALGLAEAGADLIVHYNRSEAAAVETVAEIQRRGVRAVAVQADLADPSAASDAVRVALDQFGRVDVLVHSASPFVRGSLGTVTRDDWRIVMGVVVEGVLELAK